MEKYVEYCFDKKIGVVTRSFYGIVTIDVLLRSWEELKMQYQDEPFWRGVISDFRGADIRPFFENITRYEHYINENAEMFKKLKLAIVSDSPFIAYSLLIQERFPNFSIQSFCTLEAAHKWIEQ